MASDQYNLKASSQFTLAGSELKPLSLQFETSNDPPSVITISGQVKDSGAQAVPGALVEAFKSTDNSREGYATTDATGNYAITVTSNTTYNVVTTKDGYLGNKLSVSVAGISVGQDITLTADTDVAKNTLYGIITDTTTTLSIGNAVVSIFDFTTGALVDKTLTNSDGEYLAPLLPNGRYNVQVSKDGYYPTISTTGNLTGPTKTEVSSSIKSLENNTTGTISGIITDSTASHNVVPDATVGLYSVSGGTEVLTQLTKTNADGLYLFGSVNPTTGSQQYIVKALSQS